MDHDYAEPGYNPPPRASQPAAAKPAAQSQKPAAQQEQGDDLFSKLTKTFPLFLRMAYSEVSYYAVMQFAVAARFFDEHPPLLLFYSILAVLICNWLVTMVNSKPVGFTEDFCRGGRWC